MNEGILRILITQKCMYNCFFCHKEGVNEKKEKKVNKDDIIFLFKVYNSKYNKNVIRFSGGEPLERDDIKDIFKIFTSKWMQCTCYNKWISIKSKRIYL